MTVSAFYAVPATVVLALSGTWMLFFAGHYQAQRERQHHERLAARLTRGTDAYFEELRDIQAYPPKRLSLFQRRIVGALALIGGASYFAIWLIR